jgi:site-specific DNA recombinase
MTIQSALYARVSSEQQAGSGTIQSQIAALVERARGDDTVIPLELQYVDDGFSGSTLVRPALERLRDAVYSGLIDRVYIHSPDRLSRKYAYQILLIDELRRASVEIVFLNRKLADTPEDELLLQVQGVVAEYERAKIMERARRGRLHAARQGSVNVLSKAPFGYQYVSKHEGDGEAQYEIVFEEARIVQQIFQWVGKERITLRQVCARLRELGIRTGSGKSSWHYSTVAGMLRNPAYIGQAAYGKTTVGPPRLKLRASRGAPEQSKRGHSVYDVASDDWIRIPVPALVTPAIFEIVQEQMIDNQKRARERKGGASYLLQGLLGCKKCGHAFCGRRQLSRANGKRTVQYTYYRCCGAQNPQIGERAVCNNKLVRSELLEDAVWSEVMRLLKDPACLEKEYKRRLSLDGKTNASQLQAERTKLCNSITRIIDGFTDGLIDRQEFEPRMKKAKAKLNKIDSEIKASGDAEGQKQQLRLLIVQLEDFTSRVSSKLDSVD